MILILCLIDKFSMLLILLIKLITIFVSRALIFIYSSLSNDTNLESIELLYIQIDNPKFKSLIWKYKFSHIF